MKASDLFVRCLEQEGVEYIFGVPGEENADIMMSLLDSPIEFVVCRHEQGAAFIADIYGRLTGKPGVCLGTLGPGATNLLTGVADANMDRAPLIVLTGQGSTSRLHKESHQAMDVVSMFRPVVKWTTAIANADTIPEIIRKAFQLAQIEKPGAVHIELSEDIAKHRSLVSPLVVSSTSQPEPNAGEIAKAAELLRGAEFPVILAGNGVLRSRATDQLVALSESTGMPVANTFMGKGAIPQSHPNCLYTVGLSARDVVTLAIEEADVVLAVGYDLVEYHPKLWNRGRPKQVISIDALAAEVDAHFAPAVDIPGDITRSLEVLLSAIGDDVLVNREQFASYRETMQQEFEQYAEDTGFPVKPQRILSDVRKALGPDDILLSDVGAHKMWIGRYYQCEGPNTCMISNGFCSMGFALPGAIGAKISFPDRKALAICGDGGFLMNVQDLETAVRLKLPMVILIWTDSQYGLIRWKQEAQFGRNSHIDFENPDFVKLAEAFGAIGKRVESADQLPGILAEALEADGPVVIDCPVDYDENMKLSRRLGEIPAATRSHWLKQTDLFSGCGSDSLEVISSFMEERSFQAGESICEEGVDGSEVFLLVDGEAVVQASAGDQSGPISLEPGACFGEMAILADQPRSATVVAGENGAQTLVLDGGVFREAVLKQPTIGMELLETLSKRLAAKTA